MLSTDTFTTDAVTTNTGGVDARLAPTTAAHRRRRHLSVYHRALRSANTPEQRAAVAARYRKLFAATGSSEPTPVAALATEPEVIEPIQLPVVPRDTVRLAS